MSKTIFKGLLQFTQHAFELLAAGQIALGDLNVEFHFL